MTILFLVGNQAKKYHLHNGSDNHNNYERIYGLIMTNQLLSTDTWYDNQEKTDNVRIMFIYDEKYEKWNKVYLKRNT